MSVNVTRRKVLGGAAAAAFTPLSAARGAAQEIIDVFRINDQPATPTVRSYDLFAWAGEGYLKFEDGSDIARWGDEDIGQREDTGLYEQLVAPDDLYERYVLDVTVSNPIALLFAGIILGFAWVAVKLRSAVVGGLWLFMVLAFVLAILVDTSLIYFWIAVAIGSIGVVAAIMDASL